ncbi:MAG: transglycosylase SLT domain-containing protein [Nitrospirae bacterium]|nr:transglycosylase SLT domain-containing protein [Nitrospirota bacterium]
MCKRLILYISLVCIIVVFTSPSYSQDKAEHTGTANNHSASTVNHRIDFSSEYSLAQSLLQKESPAQVIEEKPVTALSLPDASAPVTPSGTASDGISDAIPVLKALPDTLKDARKAEVATLYENYGFNKSVERSLNYYSKKIKEKFNVVLGRSGRYLSMITEIFKEKNLPQELVFLPLIESGFNMYAYSPARASGLWQFIAGTGKRYGLKIDWWVDERRDPIKATIAAADYLSDLYGMFGSWNLALAAYNAGEWRIVKAIDKTKTDNFWALRETRHIKKETKDYVPFYIAATAIAKDPEGFGFENVSYNEPMAYDEVIINSPMDIEAIARYAETDEKEIRDLNPELKRWCTPPNVSNYTVRVPAGTREKFLAGISNAEDNSFSIERYTVKKGDTLKKIASRFSISTDAVTELNSLDRNSRLAAGTTILVPPKSAASLTKDTEVSNKKKSSTKSRKASKKRRNYLVTSAEKKGKTS